MNAICPRDTIQFMRFNYNEYVKQVFKLAKINFKHLFKDMRQYANYTPYQL
jgi:hypothetical protein